MECEIECLSEKLNFNNITNIYQCDLEQITQLSLNLFEPQFAHL